MASLLGALDTIRAGATISPLPTQALSHAILPFLILILLLLPVLRVGLLGPLAKTGDRKPSTPGSTVPFVTHRVPFFGLAFVLRREGPGFISRKNAELGHPGAFTALIRGRRTHFVADMAATRHVLTGRIPQLSFNGAKFLMIRNAMGSFDDRFAKIVSEATIGHSIMERHILKSDGLSSCLREFQKCLCQRFVANAAPPREADGGLVNGWSRVGGILEFFGSALWVASAEVIFGCPPLANEEGFRLALSFDSCLPTLTQISSKTMQQILCKEGFKAREIMVEKFKRVLSNEQRYDNGTISELTKEIDQTYSHFMTLDQRSRLFGLLIIASFFNTVPTTFWVVYHILSDTEAYDAVCKEVLSLLRDKKIHKDGVNNEVDFSLSDLDTTPVLDSIISEALRLHTVNSVMRPRIATEDFELKLPAREGKLQFQVKKGEMVIASPTLAHRDKDVFKEPLSFQWDRFLPGENGVSPIFLQNGRQLRDPLCSFGGGSSLCPGRKFSLAEIKVVVGLMIAEYDMRFIGGITPDPPEYLRTKTPRSFGMPASDVAFELRRRSSSKAGYD